MRADLNFRHRRAEYPHDRVMGWRLKSAMRQDSPSQRWNVPKGRASLEGIEIRADRFDLRSDHKIAVTINGEIFGIINASETGFCFASSKCFEIGTTFDDVVMTYDGSAELYRGRVKIARRDSLQIAGYEYGVILLSSPLNEYLFHAIETMRNVEEELAQEKDLLHAVPQEFLNWVMEIRSFLADLKTRVDEVEEKAHIMSQSGRESMFKATELVLAPFVTATLTELGRKAHHIVKSMPNKETLRYAKGIFRRELDEYFRHAPFIERARKKPLGYAGDFEMMNQIYRNEFEGSSLFGALLHKWGINEASSHSVRYRRTYFKEKFRELSRLGREIKIASIAAGPAKEIVDYLGEVSQAELDLFTFVIIDQDKEALLNAKRHITEVLLRHEKDVKVIYVPTSVKQILEGGDAPRKLSSLGFDMIYSVGLYDYLTQPVAKLLTRELTSWLNPGGQIHIGNFHPSNPTHTMSELAAEWSLILRTEPELLDLVRGLPLTHAKVTADDQGIELFLTAQRMP